jgi:DeoR family transcriptional regulator of aga operon
VVATAVAYDLPARYRIASGDPRERIARAAAELVRPEEVVGFNGGTMTAAIARHIASAQTCGPAAARRSPSSPTR